MNTIKQGYIQTKVVVIPEDWKKIELGETLSISSKKFNPIGNNENKKCVELEHLSQETGKLLGYTNSSEQQSIKNSFEEGQVLFGKLRPYLKKFWKAEFEGVCSSEIWVMSGKKVKNDFLFYLVQTEKFNQIANVSSGSKMPRADWNYMSEIPFDIPPLKEQEKIAEILTTWDEAISNVELLILNYELRKKALMQKLLSGEVRFDGFSDEWEEVRLGEICKITTGKLNANAMVENGQYTFFTCARETYKINEFAFDTEALLVSGNGANVGYIHYFNGKFNAYQRTYVLDGFEHNIFLIKYLLDKYLSLQISREKNEGNTPYITLPTLTKMKLKLPSLPEQQKIAEVLSLADDEINLLKNSLVELNLQKKALMQKLLTGEVRVKI